MGSAAGGASGRMLLWPDRRRACRFGFLASFFAVRDYSVSLRVYCFRFFSCLRSFFVAAAPARIGFCFLGVSAAFAACFPAASSILC